MEQSRLLGSLPEISHGFCDREDSRSVENPVLLKQIHSARVLCFDRRPEGVESADAVVTRSPLLNLAIQTGDCAPVLLADPLHHVIGAAHAGWRGARSGVVETTLLAMVRQGADIKEIVAAIGPCIHQEHYQVSADFQAQFSADVQRFFAPFEDGVHFDLPSYVAYRLKEAGVKKVDVSPIDTYTDLRFYSYRRDPKDKVRQLSYICLNP